MTNAQYTFLPWLRRGIVSLASAERVVPTARLAVALQLQVTGEGEETRTEVVPQTARLYGPGDVTGIDWSAIVSTTPHSGVRDFEANFLASIEFYDEDFPWRYTPAVAQDGHLHPWLWLVVLEAGEYTRQGVSAGRLPVIDIAPEALKSAFPPPDTTWAWAHVHLNFALQPDQQTDEACTFVRQKLDTNPNLGCSRLLCPRRLKANTRYTAFLLPAFEKGRLAGMGESEKKIDDTPNAQASWPAKEAVGPEAVPFPVYYEWEFSTTDAGDFEDLARRLQPLDPTELDPDAHLLDLQEPGWGLRYRSTPGRTQPGAVVVEGALRIPKKVEPDLEVESSDLAFGKDAADAAFSKALCDLLNLGVEPVADQSSLPPADKKMNPFFGANLDDDPVVVPPLYGSFYRPTLQKKTNPASTLPLLWYNQLNSNPIYRVAAGQGAAVVQHNQEEFIDRAWDHLRQHIETRALVQRWQLSLHASQAFFAKRLAASLSPDTISQDVQRFRMVNLTAPMHTRLTLASRSFASSIRSSKFGAVYSSPFAKLTRSSGPLMRRFTARGDTRTATLFFKVPPAGAVRHADLTGPSDFPPAAGRPVGYTWDVDGTQHVVYRGADRHIHELWRNVTGNWAHNDLTDAAGAPDAEDYFAGDPAGYTWDVDGTQHVVYCGADRHIHELWFSLESGWAHNDLTDAAHAPDAVGRPVGYTWDVDGTQHVVYCGADRHIHELWFSLESGWAHNDLTDAAHAPPGAAIGLQLGDPVGYTWDVDGTQHVVYCGSDRHIHELWFSLESGWAHNDLTDAADAPNVRVGDPAGYTWDVDGTQHVVYCGSDRHIHELRFSFTSNWAHHDLTITAGAPSAAGAPAAYVTADGTQHVIYRSSDGNLHELWRNVTRNWTHVDLTNAAGAPSAAGDPTGYVAADRTQHVIYRGGDDHVHELQWDASTGNVSPLEKAVTVAFNVVNQGGTDMLDSLLQQNGLVGLEACKQALERLQRSFQILDSTIPRPPSLPQNDDLYTSIAAQMRPATTIPIRLRAMFGTPISPANLDAERLDLARATVEFPEPMYYPLAERSPDSIIPGLAGIPSDRVTIMVPNPAFIEAYLLGLNHEMAREFLWREFPVTLDGTFFRQFWDVRDNPKAAEEPALFKDITPVSGWGTTELGSSEHRPDGTAGNVLVVVMRSELLRKYPYTEVFMQKAVWTQEQNTLRNIRKADFSASPITPFFSARIAPDFILLGLTLVLSEAIGSTAPQDNNPGWYFALKERPGDVHFGLDRDESATDPSWPALEDVPEHHCINAASQHFTNLPRYGERADKIAAMLYQRPFVLYVHASRLLPRE